MNLLSSSRKLAQPIRAMSYQGAIAALNQLISGKPTPSPPPSPDPRKAALRRLANFQRLFDHIQNLEMEEPLSQLRVIHVAGTKGKGSTCAFTESILRTCGYRTGLFTSPHLLDIRERFRFNGVEVSEANFAKHFWWCWDRLQATTCAGLPMPGFFPFLTLLALKMFTMENIDVAILEVGLGGRYDATNIIRSPVVCGITSLGFDHMEILGNTLGEIASEKAGIFKAGVPAVTAPQQPEAMEVLQAESKRQGVSLDIVPALDPLTLGSIQLGLEGDHQRVNAALAVALCALWEKQLGLNKHLASLQEGDLPASYLQGLATTSWPGRAQVIHDTTLDCHALDGQAASNLQKPKSLTFYLDGAHSPESMEACASWFCSAVTREEARNKEGYLKKRGENLLSLGMHCPQKNGFSTESLEKAFQSQRVLLFNCMPKRDPQLLLPLLMKTCKQKGFSLHMALFVPPFSSTTSIDTRTLADIYTSSKETKSDLSWQKVLQQTWESLQGENHQDLNLAQTTRDMELSTEFVNLRDHIEGKCKDLSHECTFGPSSAVMSSLPTAVNWLRCWALCNQAQLQVLVTGSLYLIGDLMKILKQS